MYIYVFYIYIYIYVKYNIIKLNFRKFCYLTKAINEMRLDRD